ncbi:hypothetical protein [Streptomyces roseolilacinus]|uniref:Uncharacterized protein n=1 Tax=Streptomyces roseolilacinus TaxID=66904 RepID=A0A918AZX2_9ACTN|nr:hypothetical protein [Streptomyces roseolilacinus]GGQ08587.1 hypothetical protein GCM10010249_28770 [Streptomyces roseolilacinus]
MALTVVYAADTGHVVGALALTGAAAPVDAAALVGRALPLRVALGGGRTAILPLNAGELAVATVDEEPEVLTDPLAFAVELTAEGAPRPALLRLAEWGGGVALAADGLTVTVRVAAARPARVVALVSDDQDTRVLAGEIPAQQDRVKLPVTLAPGSTHGVLVLVAGWAGRLEKAGVT